MEEEITTYKARKVLSLTIWVADGVGLSSGVVVIKWWSGIFSFLAEEGMWQYTRGSGYTTRQLCKISLKICKLMEV